MISLKRETVQIAHGWLFARMLALRHVSNVGDAGILDGRDRLFLKNLILVSQVSHPAVLLRHGYRDIFKLANFGPDHGSFADLVGADGSTSLGK